MAEPLLSLTYSELAHTLMQWGYAPTHAATIWRLLYRDRVTSLSGASDLPTSLRAKFEENAHHSTVVAERSVSVSADGQTTKYLLALHDACEIETVAMRHQRRLTACVSSQVGCALGCVFCATGQQGFARNLSTDEIVAQALHVARLSTEPLRNVVLMGMGEPLQNYDAAMQAIDILRDPAGLAIAAKRITVSTVGVIPGIVRLADERRTCSLAVSLHAATQDERAAMLPAARAWPLDELMNACRYYSAKLGRRIFFEWTLIEDQNDSIEQAEELAKLLHNVAAHVNLIPLNPTAGYAGLGSQGEAMDRFQAVLHRHNIPNTVRRRRGIEIAAGCGQLAAVTNH
jgi:23S rRNA (adenine2503-C2)-methyltransferase